MPEYDPNDHFVARAEIHRHRGKWTITRLRDQKVMTQFGPDSAHAAANWLHVWGPMHQ